MYQAEGGDRGPKTTPCGTRSNPLHLPGARAEVAVRDRSAQDTAAAPGGPDQGRMHQERKGQPPDRGHRDQTPGQPNLSSSGPGTPSSSAEAPGDASSMERLPKTTRKAVQS